MSKKQKKPKTPDEEDGIFSEYFKYTRENRQTYGEKTLVLMQVGSFYEIYAVKNAETGEITETLIVDAGEVCQLNISEKKAGYGKNGVILMAGFQLYQIDKYLPKLLDAGYVVPLYIQDKEGKKDNKTIPRNLARVFSPGTYVSCDTDSSSQITNNMMCIWMETYKPLINSNSFSVSKTRDTLIVGISVINIFTGKSFVFEYKTPFIMTPTTFDELERCISVFSPSEVLILSPFEEKDLQKIKQFTWMKAMSIQSVDTRNIENKKVVNCSNQKYIKQIVSSIFGEETYNICSEFQEHILATQSFCYMVNFIQEHNRELIRKISIPEFNNSSDGMVLANHTLIQLNIIDDSPANIKNHGQFSSVLSLLNKCCSAMGKRKFKQQLTCPTFNEEWLNKEYEMISRMLSSTNYELVPSFRKLLRQLNDIEKICRQLVLKKIYPSSLANLYKSIENIMELNAQLSETPEISDYLCDDFIDENEDGNLYVKTKCISLLSFLNSHFDIELCKSTYSMTSFENNIIRAGISQTLDEKIRHLNSSKHVFSKIHDFLNKLVQQQEKSNDSEYIKIHETEKSGCSLQITTKRSEILKKIIISGFANGEKVADKMTIDEAGSESVHFLLSDIKFIKTSSSSTVMNISFPLLEKTCSQICQINEKIDEIISMVFLELLDKLENGYFDIMENLASYVAKVDVLQTKAFIAKEYNYCRPEIVSNVAKSFCDTVELRHCLIEHLQQNELYVTNDVSLGNEHEKTNGILLYGTNAVGKTSLIRALGVSIIMAQSGMYVPCSRFRYKPYTAIYSRILANDNLFKGLSTFAVEMSELRIILKMADENSLILGDELCSGTETESALSIFVAGLMELHEKKSSFIFATHFHEIINYEEIGAMENLQMKHMAVSYDRENDCLIYDRKLKKGSGPRTYGLEVCKSLYLGDDFLDKAYSIRNKYYPETQGELSFSSTKYNSKKIRGFCESCKKQLGEEIHHMQPQKDADEDGFIGTFHKNHPANLLTVCEECHNKIHDSSKSNGVILKRKKTTKGYLVVG